jgi:2-oxoglutarate dehydrogenase E1 component
MAAQDNIRVVNCTTAAQYFHVLRRQVKLFDIDPRPLIVMSPKSLLRHPRATSRLEQLSQGSFQPVIEDRGIADRRDAVTRVIACSGHVYVDLRDSGLFEKAPNVAIIRVEELYPIPEAQLAAAFAGYPNMRELVWVQEEPRNMGAWSFLSRTLESLVPTGVSVSCVSRSPWSTPAEGDLDAHNLEQRRIVTEAFGPTVTANLTQGAVRGH